MTTTPDRRFQFGLVIFDLDGTLVDSVPDIAWALNRTLAEDGMAPLSVPAVRALVGDGAAQLVARAMPAGTPSAAIHERVAHFIAHYQAHVAVETRLYPGIEELLVRLQQEGMPVAVITNKPKPVAERLFVELGLGGRFVAVVGDGDGFPNKPDPAGALHLLTSRALTPADAVVVGDGIPDVRMARALGATSVSVTWGYVSEADLRREHPTHLVSTPSALAHILLAVAPA